MSIRSNFFPTGVITPLLVNFASPTVTFAQFLPPNSPHLSARREGWPSVEIAAAGADLDGANAIRFSNPGITAKPVRDSDSAVRAKYTVTISADVPQGIL